MIVWLIVMALVFIGIPFLYRQNLAAVNSAALGLAELELHPFAHVFRDAADAYDKVRNSDPAGFDSEAVLQVLTYAGSWLRWPAALLLVLCGVASLNMSRVEKLSRRFTLDTLIKNNCEMFPCLYPVVGRGKTLLSVNSFDAGQWRIARTPLQFAIENKLLLNKDRGELKSTESLLEDGIAVEKSELHGKCRLDYAHSNGVFVEQLGAKFVGVRALGDVRASAAAAFLAYGCGDKKAAVALLDAMSLSYVEAENADTPAAVGVPPYGELLAKHESRIEGEPLLVRHSAFVLPWFMALIAFARRKGILACSQFLWMRPVDRPLWYALSQTGGNTAFAEGYAAWAHYHAEEQVGKRLTVAHVDGAVRGLEKSLLGQGVLMETSRGPTR
jgi:hypothetical protein